MSARVFIPLPFENMVIRSPNAPDRRTIRRGTEKVRRVLFGPVDHAETKRIFETEFTLQKTNDKERWDFDFEREIPLNRSNRYIWKPVMNLRNPTIDMSPVKRKRSLLDDIEDNSDCYPPPLSAIVPPQTICQNVITNNKHKKQCLITGKQNYYLLFVCFFF